MSGEDPRAAATVGFVGLGLMGAPMAANLVRAGFEVAVHNRSDGAAEELVALGARRVAEVADLAQLPVIIFMLPDLPFIEAAAEALLERWRREPPAQGATLLVMSTVAPDRVRGFGAVVREASGGRAAVVDAPVSGGRQGAVDGTLAVMAGGAQEDFDRVEPVLKAMGRTVRLMGPLGAGSLTKACNQLVVGTTAAALAEAVVLAEHSGIEPAALLEILGGGLANSTVLQQLGPRFAARDYTVTAPAKFMHKDLRFVLAAAEEAGTAVPLATAGERVYAAVNDQGLGDLDLAVVREAIEHLGEARVRQG
ncbi:NAD(P)-dependent oxidoreductase [Paenarthrobacter sp. DKR-5]|uniref:NAD(P)-dependent oxidoreductase n=1 Tax=Paenarthrobacter sp. DKR-5 TaxID=2835535 RepID=UPI001BDD4FA6|nr:NAD(P)-dependent oxidoreductase [Paenarthrobacter sp. DKR-5]MBT1001376.1 NAD(P)-dependent oxidoreductase [Paenarthrobacter sp. DKR-5]